MVWKSEDPSYVYVHRSVMGRKLKWIDGGYPRWYWGQVNYALEGNERVMRYYGTWGIKENQLKKGNKKITEIRTIFKGIVKNYEW